MTTAIDAGAVRDKPLAADTYERVLSAGSVVLGIAVVAAIARGRAQWGDVPAIVWLHIATVMVAVALTPVILLGRRGDARHRWLGRVWAVAMLLTALLTFAVQTSHPGHYSLIHLLSLFTVVQVPVIWWTAHKHKLAWHRRSVRGMVTGALLVAGFLTFPFDRLLGRWLFG